jgi:hypothetical protein
MLVLINDEDSIQHMLARCLQQIERAAGVDINIVKRAVLGQVVRGLGRAVDDQVGVNLLEDFRHGPPVPDVQRAMLETAAGLTQVPQGPGGVPLRPEEVGPHVIVNPVDPRAAMIEITDGLRSYQSTATCYHDFHRSRPLICQ